MSSRSIFHNLTWKFSAFYKFSEKKQQRRSEYFKVKIVVILILISIITHEIKLLRESEK